MRSPSDDLTTRARIRDAAITLFGRDGFAATSVRAVASEAGVSPALVIHHFGTKDGLRAACDEQVLDEFLGRKDDIVRDPAKAAATIQLWLGDIDRHRSFVDYLARMITDDSPASDQLFDRMLAGTAAMFTDHVEGGIMRESSDPELLAAWVTAYGLAPLLMRRQLSRALGADDFDEGFIRRSTLPVLELYTHGIYRDDRFLVAAREALAATDRTATDRTPADRTATPHPRKEHG